MNIIDTLVTDRTPAHAARVAELSSIGWDNMTDNEKMEWIYGEALENLYWSDGEIMRFMDGILYLFNGNATNKGAYNWQDLNRVCNAMEYLYNQFKESGYRLDYERIKPTADRIEWQIQDVPSPYQRDRYLQNAKSIRAALSTFPDTPELPASVNNFDTAGANAIEQVLIDIDIVLTATTKAYIRSGMTWAYSGAPGVYAVS